VASTHTVAICARAGNTVVVSDPAPIKQAFRAAPSVLHAGTGSPLRAMLGSNSLLGIDEEQQHM
jgi:cytochrome P450 family 138